MLGWAQEPGYLRNETPAPRAPKPVPAPRVEPDEETALLTAEFARARGLDRYEVRTLDYMRIACARRVFSPDGWQVQGDADLKVTNVGPDYLAAELPSHFSFVSFGGFNPYGNAMSDVDTVSSVVLLNVRRWRDGQVLKIKKLVNVSSTVDNSPPENVPALDEIKVLDGTYPSMFMVRETIYAKTKFTVYFICQ
jgi:hypothetical protein